MMKYEQKRISKGLADIYISKDPTLEILRGEEVAESVTKYATDPKGLNKKVEDLRKKMKKLSGELEFEEAAKIRDDAHAAHPDSTDRHDA